VCWGALTNFLYKLRLNFFRPVPTAPPGYAYGRRPYVRTGSSTSSPTLIVCGVHQGLVLGPLQSCRPSASLKVQNNITSCVDDVPSWMRSNRLHQLNTAMTDIPRSATGRRSHQLPQSPLRVGNDEVMSAVVVRDRGIYIDAAVSMRSHVTKTVSDCFAVLRQLRSVRRSVSRPVFQSLAASDTAGPARQCQPCRNPTVPAEAAPVGDELRCPAVVFFIEIRPHHSGSPSAALVQGDGAQACCPCIQLLTWSSTAADLGMFSMFGRTGAPQKGAPQKERQLFACRKNGRPPSKRRVMSKKTSPVF